MAFGKTGVRQAPRASPSSSRSESIVQVPRSILGSVGWVAICILVLNPSVASASQAPDIFRKVNVVVFSAGFIGNGAWRDKHQISRFLSAKLAKHFDQATLDLPKAPLVRSAYDPQGPFDVVEGVLSIKFEIALRETSRGVTMAYTIFALRKTKRRATWEGVSFDQKFNQMGFGIIELQTHLVDDSSKFRVFDAAAKAVDAAFINPYIKWKRLLPQL